MEEVMPMEFVKDNFKTNIYKLTLLLKRDFVSFYEAMTSYGKMNLIVEEFFSDFHDNGDKKRSSLSKLEHL